MLEWLCVVAENIAHEEQCAHRHCAIRFSHDLGSIPCKFFASGWCHYEERCTFSHDERTLVLSAIKLLRDESLDVLVTPETVGVPLTAAAQVIIIAAL